MSEKKSNLPENFLVVEVSEPQRIIPPEKAKLEAPEFNFPPTVDVVTVGQRQAKYSYKKPLFTKGITQCELEIVQTTSQFETDNPKYAFIHVQAGELSANEEGSKVNDIVENIQDISLGIMVSGSNSINT